MNANLRAMQARVYCVDRRPNVTGHRETVNGDPSKSRTGVAIHIEDVDNDDFGPLRLPRLNPAVRPFKNDASDPQSKWSRYQFEQTLEQALNEGDENVALGEDHTLKLAYAEDTHLTDQQVSGRHIDNELRCFAVMIPYLLRGSHKAYSR